MSEHELKCWPEFFSAILTGEKTFELRKDDRQPPFRAGDVLWLREWRRGDKEYTGRDLRLTVTYVLSGFGLEKDYVVMGFRLPAPATDYERFKADHPEMLKMAEEHLAETERMAETINRLQSRADHWKEQREYWCDQSNKADDKLEQTESSLREAEAQRDRLADDVRTRSLELDSAQAALRMVEDWCKATAEAMKDEHGNFATDYNEGMHDAADAIGGILGATPTAGEAGARIWVDETDKGHG